MKPSLKTLLPIAVLAFGGVATIGLIAATPRLETRKPQHRSPLVRVIRAQPDEVALTVQASGTVVPRTESDIVAEISGRIIEVSPSLASGGFLEPDEVLVTIDPSDYEIAVERAKAALARAESRRALAAAELERQTRLARKKVASPAALENARSAAVVAGADERDARAGLDQALANLERTRIRVPFTGRVRHKLVDVGQYVNRGTAVARIYAVDYAEVRLPIPDRDAAFVNLPIGYRGDQADRPGPEVLLSARFAGHEYTWRGRIVRTEGELDPKTRMIHAVARIEDPYGRGDDPDRPPLAVGLFVDARIQGRRTPDVVRLPRAALRGSDQVVVVGDDERVELRTVEVLRHNREYVLISSGLQAGESVVTGPLAVAVNGMKVRTIEEQNPFVPAVGAPEEPSLADAGADAGAKRAEAIPEAGGTEL